jgi:hypothetical protein
MAIGEARQGTEPLDQGRAGEDLAVATAGCPRYSRSSTVAMAGCSQRFSVPELVKLEV